MGNLLDCLIQADIKVKQEEEVVIIGQLIPLMGIVIVNLYPVVFHCSMYNEVGVTHLN